MENNNENALKKEKVGKKSKDYSKAEENANAISHLIGLGMAVAAYPILILKAVKEHSVHNLLAYIIFNTSLIILYAMSSSYHLVRNEKAKKILKIFDHSAIFVLIAGTYTAYVMTSMQTTKGYIILTAQWTLVVLGILFKLKFAGKKTYLSTLIYLLMGWMVAFVFPDLSTALNKVSFWLIVSMGITYTAGCIFYVLKKINFTHFVFHIFVVGGSVLSFLSIYFI